MSTFEQMEPKLWKLLQLLRVRGRLSHGIRIDWIARTHRDDVRATLKGVSTR